MPDVPTDPAAQAPGASTASDVEQGGADQRYLPDRDNLPTSGEAKEWVCPGVSPNKRWLTGGGIALTTAVFIFIAAREGAAMWVSTAIGVVFIGCFIWYLRIVAPMPFTLRLDAMGITRTERGGEPTTIPWMGLARVKEESFPNGKPVSLAVYKRVGERGVHRAFVVYRDDIPRFDAFLAAVRAALPGDVPYQRETVHE
jgi:hypothetical protein